jgi:hypothetical protein
VRWRRGESSKGRMFILSSVLLATSFVVAPGATRAEGFLDLLFGGPQDRPAPTPPAPVNNYAEPPARVAPPPLGRETVHRGGGSTGHSVAFCVRLCDGKGFPMEHYPNATPVETCRAMCPASKTMVFFGAEIDNAVAHDGAHYAGLEHAFLYRKQLVANCTCNGRDTFGLAPFEMANDPTLRPGDIVVTKTGLMSYTGKSGPAGDFTPVDPASISAQLNSVTAAARSLPRAKQPVQATQDEPAHLAPPENGPAQSAQPQILPPVVDLQNQDGR